MDGGDTKRNDGERPIAKPSYPLPGIFHPSKRTNNRERAHFFRKGTTESGSPVYGFYITQESTGQNNPGSRRQQDVS